MTSLDSSLYDFKPLSNTGEKVPAIGIGTKGIQDYRAAEGAISYGFSLGLRLVEVSDSYGDGLAEELIGRVVRRFKRDEIFIVLRLNAIKFSHVEAAVKAVYSSLRRMGLSYVDITLADGVNELVDLSVQIKALESLVDKGLTRYIGLSNFKLKDLIKSLELLSRYNIVAVQYKYSVIDKRVEKDLLKFVADKGITFLACSPLEKGTIIKNPKLMLLSSKYGKSPVQVALNYLISRPYVVATPKSERKNHIEEIHGSIGWRLSSEDIRYLERE
ncbi:MAG: aldo/keto reductase [Ignisphaera sp.]|uniref:Aldo/keto reductase n=1 Tax=Ignisphaera aggregans TaxID=334771 RepID=A0A832C9G7_9CREN